MFDSPETPATPTAPAAPATPSDVTAPVAAPAVAPANVATPATFDPAEFEQSLKQFGPDWSIHNWKDKLTEERKTLGTKGRELVEITRKYSELDAETAPFRKAMKEDQAFNSYISDSVRNYFASQAAEPTMQGYTPQNTANPLYGFDPNVQRLNQLENEMKMNRFNAEFQSLAAKDYPLDEDMANTLLAKSSEPGYDRMSPTELYFSQYGSKVVQLREQKAAEAAAAAIQTNNNSYTPGGARQPAASTAPAGPPDMKGWSYEQFDAYARQQARERLGGLG